MRRFVSIMTMICVILSHCRGVVFISRKQLQYFQHHLINMINIRRSSSSSSSSSDGGETHDGAAELCSGGLS